MPSTNNWQVRTLYLVKLLESIVRARLDAALREYKLTTAQYTVLSLLNRPDPLSSAQVARRSFVTPQASNEMIACLEKKGFIKRTEDSKTRRILRLSLTSAGLRALDRSAQEIERIENELLRNLMPIKATGLRQSLSTIVTTARDLAADRLA